MDRRRRLNRGAVMLGRLRERLGYATHAASGIPERLFDSVDLMEEHVAEHQRGPERLRTRREADRRPGGEHRFALIGFGALVEGVRGTLPEQTLRQVYRL